jgi:hypothetical protein
MSVIYKRNKIDSLGLGVRTRKLYCLTTLVVDSFRRQYQKNKKTQNRPFSKKSTMELYLQCYEHGHTDRLAALKWTMPSSICRGTACWVQCSLRVACYRSTLAALDPVPLAIATTMQSAAILASFFGPSALLRLQM